MALAVITAVTLQFVVPHGGRIALWWVFPVFEVAFLVLLIVLDPGRIDRRSAAARNLTIGLIAVMSTGTLLGVVNLLHDIVGNVAGITATDLLGRGAALWVSNILAFSLWYWVLDRGGPAERAARSPVPPSFAFPENTAPDLVRPGWIPAYPDYLYLSFTNSTAFSPTDTLPLQTWAKLTLMIQAAMQLATAILVIARAINVLPG
jgi:hypothetical protein